VPAERFQPPRKRLRQMASEHHQLNDLLRASLVKISFIEEENKSLKDQLEELKIKLVTKKAIIHSSLASRCIDKNYSSLGKLAVTSQF